METSKNLGFYKITSVNCVGFVTEESNGKWFNTIGGAWKLKRMSRTKASKKEIEEFKKRAKDNYIKIGDKNEPVA